jgi:hypothetical protein
MASSLRFLSLRSAAVVLMLVSAPAWSTTTGKTEQGGDFVSGGVTVGELQSLNAAKKDYRLWVVTAAKGSGAHLADVRVVIVDAKKTPVLDTRLDGPWLLVDLPPGNYHLEASYKGQTHKRQTTVGKRGLRQMVLYFDDPAEVSPEWVSPFEKKSE